MSSMGIVECCGKSWSPFDYPKHVAKYHSKTARGRGNFMRGSSARGRGNVMSCEGSSTENKTYKCHGCKKEYSTLDDVKQCCSCLGKCGTCREFVYEKTWDDHNVEGKCIPAKCVGKCSICSHLVYGKSGEIDNVKIWEAHNLKFHSK